MSAKAKLKTKSKQVIEVFVPPSADALLEPAAVAKLLGVSRAKLKTMVAAGDYPQCDVRIGTGFRAHEIGTLTPEQFDLASDSPTVTVLASCSKRGKRSGRDDVQPIRRDLADAMKDWVASRPPGEPCFPLPHRTAQMLASDLERAGIDPRDAKGRVLDFHALRHTYVTHLVNQGINIKTVQVLARHSTITLTMDRYTTVESGDIRDAIEGKTQEKTRVD